MFRFLHTSDWQLGMTRHFLSDEAQARFSDDRFEAVRKIGALARERGAAFVVVCGDVFESNQLERRTVSRALEALASIPVPVYLLPGNHDPLDAASVFRQRHFQAHLPAQVRVLETSEPIVVAPGVELVGAPWTSKRPEGDLVRRAAAGLEPRSGLLRILAGHGAVDTLVPGLDECGRIELAAAESLLGRGILHYLALGDRHSCTAVGASGRVHYSGAPEPTDFDEVDPGKALLVELGPGGARVEALPLASWCFLRWDRRLDRAEDLDALERELEAIPRKERTILKLGLVGRLGLRELARLDGLLERARELVAAIVHSRSRSDLEPRLEGHELEELALSGYARAAARRLQELVEAGGEEGRVAFDALGLLMRLAESGP